MKHDFFKKYSVYTNEELIDILENHQYDVYHDALIVIKQILEERNIKTTQYKIRQKPQKRKQESEFSIAVLIISIGFSLLGIYMLRFGLEENEFTSIAIGLLITFAGLGLIFLNILPKVGLLFGYLTGIIYYVIFYVVLLGIMAIPLLSENNLSIDFGVFTLRDGLVRFLIIALDCYIIFSAYKYLKRKLYDKKKS